MIETDQEREEYPLLEVTIVVLALLDFFFSLKYIYEVIDMYTINIVSK